MAEKVDIVIPDLGDFSDVEIIEVLVQPQDQVKKEDGLLTLETDKATMDVPADRDGTIDTITVRTGDRVSTGDVIGSMTVDKTGATPGAPAEEDAAKQDAVAPANVEAPSAEAPAPESGGEQTLAVPDLGDFDDVDVIEVHVSPGSRIEVDEALLTLETDKATMDVPATVAGTVTSVLVKAGDKVSKGSAIAVVDADAAAKAAPAPETAAAPASRPAQTPGTAAKAAAQAPAKTPSRPQDLPRIEEAGFSKAHASPSVRRLARELGVDLASVKGSGPKNRILHDDVKAFVKAIVSGGAAVARGPSLPQVPKVDFAKFGEIDVKPLTRIQKISGPRLQASWVNVPHVTQHDIADITELEEKRQALKGPAKEKGISLTPLAFIMKACIAVLKEFPSVNASLSEDGESLVLKKYFHLGFAADTEQGLMVPVIRDADSKDVYELAAELGKLSAAAREGKLKGEQLQGASFTISSLGGIGGTAFTPIVNAPEVAILGVSRASMQPVWDGEKFEPRLMMPLSFSYDHRVIDGASAVRFTTSLAAQLGDVEKLLEATI